MALVTVADVVKEYGVSSKTVYRLLRHGKLKRRDIKNLQHGGTCYVLDHAEVAAAMREVRAYRNRGLKKAKRQRKAA